MAYGLVVVVLLISRALIFLICSSTIKFLMRARLLLPFVVLVISADVTQPSSP